MTIQDFIDLTVEYNELKKKFGKRIKEVLEDYLAKNTYIVALSADFFVPGFNDGNPCVWDLHHLRVVTKDDLDESGNLLVTDWDKYESGVSSKELPKIRERLDPETLFENRDLLDEFDIWTGGEKRPQVRALIDFLEVLSPLIEANYGNCTIKALKGTVEIDQMFDTPY